MNRFKRGLMWAALILIILLIFLSIYGAFVGAERAKSFFNSIPLSVYWLVLTVTLIAGLVAFRRLARVPSLLLVHLGCIFILAGSMWGSNAGHKLQRQLFGINKIPKGQMVIHEGHSENLVQLEDGKPTDSFGKLSFSIKLKDFRVEYYKPEYLQIQSREGQSWRIPVKINTEFSLGSAIGTVTVLRTFENFKITIDGDGTTAFDDPEPGYNPALEVQIKHPDGTMTTQYVFERFPGHIHREDKLLLSYQRTISDYISELEVIKNNKVVAQKSIEVNHPLYFGGYHFYQHSYDAQAGQYTVLEVVSDSGLGAVYAGFLMLCIGVFWHLWLRRLSFREQS
jgi:hypothetical protein